MKYLLLLPTVLIISACVSNTFERNFISRAPEHTMITTKVVHQEPELIETDNLILELENFPKQAYMVLGINDFSDKMRSREPAIKFAKKINATHILYSRTSLGKRYVNIAAATSTKAMSDLGTYPSYHPNNRKYLKENYYHYAVVYLRDKQQ